MTKFRYEKTRDELLAELREQVEFLRASARSYDAGFHPEAKRLAATVYTLCRDGNGKTVSLLSQLGLRSKVTFLSTVDVPEKIGLSSKDMVIPRYTPLCKLHMESGPDGFARYEPIFDDSPLFGPNLEMPFADWWEERIFYGKTAISVSRKNLVCSLRDQHGGGHVDASLTDESYHSMSIGAEGPTYQLPGQSERPFTNAHLASMRQIAWEVDVVLNRLGV